MKEKRRGSRAGSRTSGTCPGRLCGQSWEKLKCGAESRRRGDGEAQGSAERGHRPERGASQGPRRQRLYRAERQTGIHLSPAGQPPRPHHRRHGHRQDRHPARLGGRVLRPGRAGVLRRREGRSVRGGRGGGAQALDRGARQRDRLQGRVSRLPGDLLGSVRQAGPPDQSDDLAAWTAALVAAYGPQRGARRRAQHRLQDRRR